MNKSLIIYGSQYGTTKRYAEHLSAMTGIEAVAFKEVKASGDFLGFARRYPLKRWRLTITSLP